jgi:phage gp36-like protein
MPIYTTLSQLARRLDSAVLAGLADDINSPPDIGDPETAAVVSQAITDGASLIDSYLLGRVDLSSPLTQAALERLNATLALYFLYARRYLDDAHNPLAAAKELVLEHLSAVARGAAKLSDGDDGAPEMVVFSTTEGAAREIDARKF